MLSISTMLLGHPPFAGLLAGQRSETKDGGVGFYRVLGSGGGGCGG